MAWSISLIENTIKISKKCASDLYKVAGEELWYSLEGVTYDGLLYFNPDHMEHMDFLWREEIQEVLNNHKVNGVATFVDAEDGARLWGYKFKNGKLKTLTGQISWKEDSK